MIRRAIPSITAIFLAVGGLAVAAGASAQNADNGSRPQSARARCDGVQQDRAACLREMGAAEQEARRNGLTSASAGNYEQNALARCRLQPVADRADCEARVVGSSGAGRTSVEGSVMGGGVIRETVTPIPAPNR
jgi:hypothetical protein